MKTPLPHLALAVCVGRRALGSHVFGGSEGLLTPEFSGPIRNHTEDLNEVASERSGKSRSGSRFTSNHFVGEFDVLNAKTPSSGVRHPFWHFEGEHLKKFQVYICCVVLFLAGILCSAGGIGGGGIYVTVLMVAGTMQVADAVPLSKSVVFFGSISSLILNMRKSLGTSSSAPKTLIDYNICRLVVPSALLGTFLGVFLNRHLPAWLILAVLVGVLVFITVSVAMKTWSQYQEEQAAAAAPPAQAGGRSDEESAPGPGRPAAVPPPSGAAAATASTDETKKSPAQVGGPMRSTMSKGDVIISMFMLVIVIVFGMLRFHAGECMRASRPLQEEVCNHPAYFWLGHGTLQRWVSTDTGSAWIRQFSFFFPLVFCAMVLLYYTSRLIATEGWTFSEAMSYSLMAIFTGCLAGLVGIGGGLIFSPFFLIMGVEPSIAVASSSTCVIFTSSSTTMQYLLTDRIIVSLTVVYGVINLIASYVGTSLVHMLQDKYGSRKSFISLIVLVGVVISTVLSIIKFSSKLQEHFHPSMHSIGKGK